MTPRTKGRLAVAALLLLLLGAGAFLATSDTVRIRYWAWRMRSARGEEARLARQRLFEHGKAALGDLYPEVIGREVRSRVAEIGSSAVVLVGRVSITSTMSFEADLRCEGATLLRAPPAAKAPRVVVATFLDDVWAIVSPDPFSEEPRPTLLILRQPSGPNGTGLPPVEFSVALDDLEKDPVVVAVREALR